MEEDAEVIVPIYEVDHDEGTQSSQYDTCSEGMISPTKSASENIRLQVPQLPPLDGGMCVRECALVVSKIKRL